MQPLFYPTSNPLETFFHMMSHTAQLSALNQELISRLYQSQLSLTQQLMTNQKTLSEVLEKQRQTSDSSGSSFQMSQNFKKPSDDEKIESPFIFNKQDDMQEIKSESLQNPHGFRRLRKKKPFKYTPYLQQEQPKETKKCETKNIIKNFIKSVFCFIKKNKGYTTKVLDNLNISSQDFMHCLSELNDRVTTIQQLRDLWVNNKYCRAFRIICSHFLRKQNMHYIFNSRIVNHSIHLKYRAKLMISLQTPHQFSILKDF